MARADQRSSSPVPHPLGEEERKRSPALTRVREPHPCLQETTANHSDLTVPLFPPTLREGATIKTSGGDQAQYFIKRKCRLRGEVTYLPSHRSAGPGLRELRQIPQLFLNSGPRKQGNEHGWGHRQSGTQLARVAPRVKFHLSSPPIQAKTQPLPLVWEGQKLRPPCWTRSKIL